MSSYILRGGSAATERLRLLCDAKWPTTRQLLGRIGLANGMRCLDVGCGNGRVAVEMARSVAPNGHVLGIDDDQETLQAAEENARDLAIRVTFQHGNARELNEPPIYDLVFARFLLTHLQDPAMVLARMVRCLRPGGRLVIEDVDFTGHFCFPDCPAFRRYVELYQAAARRRGVDPEIGPRLLGMFMDAGLREIGLEVVLPTFYSGDGKRVAAVTMEHIRESVMGMNLATDEEIDKIIVDLDHFTSNPQTQMSMARIFQVWGSKPMR